MPQRRSGYCVGENSLLLSGIKPRFLCLLVRNLITTLTELIRLKLKVKNAGVFKFMSNNGAQITATGTRLK
jgi:hypothetical protein